MRLGVASWAHAGLSLRPVTLVAVPWQGPVEALQFSQDPGRFGSPGRPWVSSLQQGPVTVLWGPPGPVLGWGSNSPSPASLRSPLPQAKPHGAGAWAGLDVSLPEVRSAGFWSWEGERAAAGLDACEL